MNDPAQNSDDMQGFPDPGKSKPEIKDASGWDAKTPPSADGPDGQIQIPKREYEALKSRLEELDGMREKLLRSAADFENAKKRLQREREEFIKFSQENLLREILPVLDNFERALVHAEQMKDPALKPIVSGVQMVFKQLAEILKAQGLKRAQSVGEIFDPHKHEAMGYVQGPGKEDEVVEEVEAGYSLHDRLLRAAKVRIRVGASTPSADSCQEEKTDEIT